MAGRPLPDAATARAPARKLRQRQVEKPWGRTSLPPIFADPQGRRIGEIWFEDGEGQDLPLLVKYIFTSDRLSIQVHPTDAQAKAIGLPRGKEEIWYILDCEPDAVLGIGLTQEMSPEAFRAAALDGSIEAYMDWKPVKPGDAFFIPAGTVHAIGAGIALVEIQQNSDITYRLYDYGRPRDLHLDAGAPISHLAPYDRPPVEASLGSTCRLLDWHEAPFRLDLLHWADDGAVALPADATRIWFTPLGGSGTIDGQRWEQGDCWLIDNSADIRLDAPASVLLATPA